MLTYRKLTAADLSMVLRMNEDFRAGFIDAACAERFLTDPDHWLFAAVQDGAVIGFAYGCALMRLDRKEKMLYIHEVGVQDAFQRQGVGYAMMRALLRACKTANICKCFLTCYQNNMGANALYRMLGGQVPQESQGNDTVYYFPID